MTKPTTGAPAQARSRGTRGSILALSTCLSLVLMMLGVFFFSLSLVCEGSRQFRDTVDAGAVAMIKNAMLEPSLKVSRDDDPYKVLEPLLEPYDGITLKNVNRLSAAALLIEMNQAAMEAEESGTFEAKRNAAQFNDKLSDIAQRFSQSMLDRQERKRAFTKVSWMNNTNMLGPKSRVMPDIDEWAPAFINKGAATNIYIERKQFPDETRPKIPTTEVSVKGKLHRYISGYMPIATGADLMVRRPQMSFFLPLRPALQPHLINEGEYAENKRAPDRVLAKYCIPNSFSAHGRLSVPQSDAVMKYNSYGVAEAMDEGYAASLPGGFIRVENNSSQTANLGDLIERPRMKDLRKRLLQRLYEIDPEFEERKLDDLLKIDLAPRRTAIIRPKDDGRGPDLLARDARPDGNKKLEPVEVQDFEFQWIPSTGYNNLLAVIEIMDRKQDGPGRGGDGPGRGGDGPGRGYVGPVP